MSSIKEKSSALTGIEICFSIAGTP